MFERADYYNVSMLRINVPEGRCLFDDKAIAKDFTKMLDRDVT